MLTSSCFVCIIQHMNGRMNERMGTGDNSKQITENKFVSDLFFLIFVVFVVFVVKPVCDGTQRTCAPHVEHKSNWWFGDLHIALLFQ